jgi:hypothetical protein
MTKKSKIALIAAGLIAGATIMGCGGNNGGIPDITGGGGIEQPNPGDNDLKLPEGFNPLSLNIAESQVRASFVSYIPNTLATQATVLKTRPLLSQSIKNAEEIIATHIGNCGDGYYMGLDFREDYEIVATGLGTMLGNDASALLDAYRNAKYLEKRGNNDNNILEGIKEASDENGSPEQLVTKLYNKLLSILKDDGDKVSRENKLALLTQVGDFAALTGWVNMLLEKGIYPSTSGDIIKWNGNYLDVPVPSIVKQNTTTIEAGAGQ